MAGGHFRPGPTSRPQGLRASRNSRGIVHLGCLIGRGPRRRSPQLVVVSAYGPAGAASPSWLGQLLRELDQGTSGQAILCGDLNWRNVYDGVLGDEL